MKKDQAKVKKRERKSHSKLSVALNKYFGHIDKGGTLGGEISGGILISILSVCGIFLNMQLIAKLGISGSYESANITDIMLNGEVYVNTYFLAMLVSFVGSLWMGLVARLPLVQVSSLGLSTVFISFLGLGHGLSYSNLLVISFLSSILYAILVSFPGSRELVYRAIPRPIRKALPAARGMLLVFVALQLSGVITIQGSPISIYGTGTVLGSASSSVALSQLISLKNLSYATDRFHPLLSISFLAVLVTFLLFLIYKRFSKRPYLHSLLTGTAFFLVANFAFVITNWKRMRFSLDSLWGRLWMVGSEDAMQYHLPNILANFSFGELLAEGFDFTAYTAAGGNVSILFFTGLLTFLLMSLTDAESTLHAADASSHGLNIRDQKGVRSALVGNAGINILAPLLGVAPIAIGKESIAGIEDGAKSGLSTVVASLGLLLSMFVWLIPALFATTTSYQISFNLYGHYGTVIQLLSETSFVVVNAVVVLVGLSMTKHSLDQCWQDYAEFGPFAATIAGSFFLSNLAAGVALGTVVFTVIKLTQIRRSSQGSSEAFREIGLPTAIFTVLSAVLLVFWTII